MARATRTPPRTDAGRGAAASRTVAAAGPRRPARPRGARALRDGDAGRRRASAGASPPTRWSARARRSGRPAAYEALPRRTGPWSTPTRGRSASSATATRAGRPARSGRRRTSSRACSTGRSTPLLAAADGARDPVAALLALRVCDPACGAGVLLVAAGERLAASRGRARRRARRRRGRRACTASTSTPWPSRLTRAALAQHGVAPAAGASGRSWPATRSPGPRSASRRGDASTVSDWTTRLPRVAAAGGFDLVLGNPPWIAHAGRAARPLPPGAPRRAPPPLRLLLALPDDARPVRRAGRGARAARRPGRARAAHERRRPRRLRADAPRRTTRAASPRRTCRTSATAASRASSSPSMALVSVRRDGGRRSGAGRRALAAGASRPGAGRARRCWPASPRCRPCPRRCSASAACRRRRPPARRSSPVADAGPGAVAIREGVDVGAFRRDPPRLALDAAHVAHGRLAGVDLLIRQTARHPIAARPTAPPSATRCWRGSPSPTGPRGLLLALLNSAPVRWHHERRFRDARQGMPQVKVGHLRAIPVPPALDARARASSPRSATSSAPATRASRPASRRGWTTWRRGAYALDGATRSMVCAGAHRR